MRLVSIEKETGVDKVLVNPEQIAALYIDIGVGGGDCVVIQLSGGAGIRTKFTDLDHATDYLQRAASHSFTGQHR